MTTATTVVIPAGAGIPAGDGGCCKRAGCGRPLPPGERGRSRQFCGDECRIRHYNGLRGQAAVPAPPPADGPEASLGRVAQLLAEASRLAATASAQVAAADPGRVAAVLAEAEAARRRAEAHAATASAQAGESAESAAAAWEAADAAEAARDAAQARAQAAAERARELEQQSAATAARARRGLGPRRGRRTRGRAGSRAGVRRPPANVTLRSRTPGRTPSTPPPNWPGPAARASRPQRTPGAGGPRDRGSPGRLPGAGRAARYLADAAIERAERAEAALDAERAERRALTDKPHRGGRPAAPARTRSRHATTEKQS